MTPSETIAYYRQLLNSKETELNVLRDTWNEYDDKQTKLLGEYQEAQIMVDVIWYRLQIEILEN